MCILRVLSEKTPLKYGAGTGWGRMAKLTYAEFKTVREDLQRLWKVKSNIDTAVRFNQRTAEQKLQNQPQIRHKKEDMTR